MLLQRLSLGSAARSRKFRSTPRLKRLPQLARGGAFRRRTLPHCFQGLGAPGLNLLAKAGRAVGLPIASEVVASEDVGLMTEPCDMLQIGARNMQNFRLLEAAGRAGRPVLQKRGTLSTIDELLLAAEYLLASGNSDVILCERGIRTFETSTRNTLDIAPCNRGQSA
ncbi:MAG: 3-deoxy-7-phosphoheptulonate synthase [Planctomycetota bacterium]|jgi:3-deoxy-7-phosphoheptulonate synthase